MNPNYTVVVLGGVMTLSLVWYSMVLFPKILVVVSAVRLTGRTEMQAHDRAKDVRAQARLIPTVECKTNGENHSASQSLYARSPISLLVLPLLNSLYSLSPPLK
jgi:hypothetical protein